MNFQDLPFDVHECLFPYFSVPDLVSLSQTSINLRKIYINPAWHTCLVGTQKTIYPDFTKRAITFEALKTNDDTPIVKNVKKKIKTLIFAKPDRGISEEPTMSYIKQSDYPALKNIILTYEPVVNEYDSNLGFYPEETDQIISRSNFLSHKMFCFDHKVRLLVNDNLELFFRCDPKGFTSKLFQKAGTHLIIRFFFGRAIPNIFFATNTQELSSYLPDFNISKLTINIIDTQLLEKLLDIAAKFSTLSQVELKFESIQNANGEFVEIWPPARLMNHSCFSKIKTFVLKVYNHKQLESSEPVDVFKNPIEFTYVTALKVSNVGLFPWLTFWEHFLFPKMTKFEINSTFSISLNILGQLRVIDCKMVKDEQFFSLIDCVPQLINLERLALDLSNYFCYRGDDSFEKFLRKRMVLANLFAKQVYEDSLLSIKFDQPVLDFFSIHMADLTKIAYEFIKHNDNFSDCLTYNSTFDCKDLVNATRPFFVELLFYKMNKLPSLNTLELKNDNYIDFCHLQLLIKGHNSLKTVHIDIDCNLMNVCIHPENTGPDAEYIRKLVLEDNFWLNSETIRCVELELQKTLEGLADVPHDYLQIPKSYLKGKINTKYIYFRAKLVLYAELYRVKRFNE